VDDNDKFSIVLFSGTVDKLMAATTLASGAVAMGKDVTLFLTNWGVVAFRKDDWKTNRRVTSDYQDYAPVMFEMLEAKRVPPWLDTLKVAMELGNLKIVACAMTMDLFDLKLEDLEPVVSQVTGVASFIGESEGGTTLFI
jgi:peroxiredoxin family protein